MKEFLQKQYLDFDGTVPEFLIYPKFSSSEYGIYHTRGGGIDG